MTAETTVEITTEIITMKLVSKLVRLSLTPFLMAALVAPTLAPVAWAEADHASKPSARLAERTAGCHAHGDNALPHSPQSHSELPAPLSYQCCLTGHDAAIVPAFHFAQPSAKVQDAAEPIEPSPTVPSWNGFEVFTTLFAYSPGLTPLRI